MVGDAALRIVVRPDLGRAVAGADLRASHARAFGLLLGDPEIEQPGAQNLHRLELVLELRLLILLADDETAGNVRDAHGRVGRVHALATRARRPKHIDADVLVL